MLGAAYRISAMTYKFFKCFLSNSYNTSKQTLSSSVQMNELKLIVTEGRRRDEMAREIEAA